MVRISWWPGPIDSKDVHVPVPTRSDSTILIQAFTSAPCCLCLDLPMIIILAHQGEDQSLAPKARLWVLMLWVHNSVRHSMPRAV